MNGEDDFLNDLVAEQRLQKLLNKESHHNLKKTFKWQKIVIQKLRMMRGYNYFVFLGMPIVVAKVIQEVLMPYYVIPMWILYPLIAVFIYVAGFIDSEWGLMSEEQDFVYSRNPKFTKLLEEVKKK